MARKKLFYWLIPILLFIAIIGNTVFATMQQEHKLDFQPSPLNGQFFLDNVVKIYVPSTYHVDQPIDNTIYVNLTLEKFSQLFGGATAIEGTGAWLANDKKLVKENVTIVYSYAKELHPEQLHEVFQYAQMLKDEMRQSSVSLEVNGKLYFIE